MIADDLRIEKKRIKMEYIYAIDGDNIGEKIENALFHNDLEKAKKISKMIEKSLETINQKFIEEGAETIFLAGDSLLVRSHELIHLPDHLLQYNDMTFSMGVANSPSDAVLALKKAKGLGKNRTIVFNNGERL